MDVDLYADPSCHWSWAAYRWLDDVAPRRQLRPRLRPFSLTLRDGTEHLPAALGNARRNCHRALRVCAAIADESRRWDFFRALCEPIYAARASGGNQEVDIAGALGATGLGDDLLRAADNPAGDVSVRASMGTVRALLPAAEQVLRIPVVVLHCGPEQHALQGPLLDPVPTGAEGVQLWDAIERVATLPGFHGLSRPRHPVTVS